VVPQHCRTNINVVASDGDRLAMEYDSPICAKDFALAVVFRYEEHKSTSQLMKKSLCLAASLLALYLTPVFGQPQLSYVWQAGTSQTGATNLTKFNLDFPGGTPQELVAAIQKATGKPLNAIIPPEDADLQLPPLKMNNIDSPQLFVALEEASVKTIAVFSPGRGYSTFNGSYGFKTADSLLSDTSIWYVREIAEGQQTTEKAVESKLSRVRRKLKDAVLAKLNHESSH